MDAVAASSRVWSLFGRAVLCGTFMTAAATAAPGPVAAAARLKARSLYAAGEKAFDAGDVETAQHDFEEAYRTLPNAAVLLKVAECKKRRSDGQGAVDTLEHYLSDRPNAPDKARVQAQIEDLKKTPGTVSVSTTPTGAAIWVDGADSGKVSPSDVEVSPGDHIITVQLSNYESAQQSLSLDFASHKDLTLTLTALAIPATDSGTAPPPSTVPMESGDTGGYRFTPAFWVAVGGTVVGAGVMTGFGVAALDKHSDYQKKPTRALYDDGRRDALIADVALGITLASAVTAGVLFFTSKSSDGRDEQAIVVAPCFERGGGGIIGHVRF